MRAPYLQNTGPSNKNNKPGELYGKSKDSIRLLTQI